MLATLLRHLRGNLIAYVALLFALTSTSYAAATKLLPANSVGSKQVINHSLLKKDFKSAQLPRGPRGARGPQGTSGARGATGTQGPRGIVGAKGDKGDTGLLGALNDLGGRPCTTTGAVRDGTTAIALAYDATPPNDPTFGAGGSGQAGLAVTCEVADSFEPNDSQQTARVVDFFTSGLGVTDGYCVSATIQPAGNDDWYQFGTSADHGLLTRILFFDPTTHPVSAEISVDGLGFTPLTRGCTELATGNVYVIHVSDTFVSGYRLQGFRSGGCS